MNESRFSEESTGRCWTPAGNLPQSFLQEKFSRPRDLVADLLRRLADLANVRRSSFYSVPEGRGRQVRGSGTAERYSSQEFLLVESSDPELLVGDAGKELEL